MEQWLYTIKGRYITLIGAIITSALLIAGCLSLYFTETFRQQEMNNQLTALENYIGQLESSMDAIRMSTVNIVTQGDTFDEMQYLPDYDTKVLAQQELVKRMQTYLSQYPQVECVFAYSSHSQDFLTWNQQNLSYSELVQLRGDIRSWILGDPENQSGDWHVHTSAGQQYLVYLYHSGTTYAGCVMRISTVLEGALSWDGDAAAALLDPASIVESVGEIMTLIPEEAMLRSSQHFSRNGQTYYVTVCPLEKTEFTVVKLLPSVSRMSSPMYVVFLIIALFTAVVIPAIFAVSAVSFSRPVHTLVDVMDRVAEGDLEVRVPMEGLSKLKEFQQIGESYNRSLEQISILTTENAKKQQAYQRAQLKAVQMQVDPHFLMNSLNIIYTASCVKKSRTVQQMCLHLSGYYRYSMSSNRDLVPLAEEIRFTEDYLHIMQLRFEDSFSYELAIAPFLKTVLVPPMVLKTFVGNSIKYAVNPQRQVKLFILAELLSEGDNAWLKLVIEDTGPGYPEEMLGKQEDIFRYDTTKHTGIRNVYDRIMLLFDGEAEIWLENRKGGGARTQILLPVRMEEENVSGLTGG